ncbi:MAG TPA: polysaccharide deacetylase family protein [Actinomycetota bacterium]|nr:polysaccharide deacetylase family protein [Actinomycetota bacterium]
MKRGVGAALCACIYLALFPEWAAADATTVAFSSPRAGEVVHGVVDVSVTTTGDVTQVLLAFSTDDGETWTDIAAAEQDGSTWTSEWNTTGLSGPVRLRATASGTDDEAVADIRVIVDQAPPSVVVRRSRGAFSPNQDGRGDRLAFHVTSSEPAVLHVAVVDPSGATQREWRFETFTRAVEIRWDGRRTNGGVVKDGPYIVSAGATGENGVTGRAEAGIVVDTRPPRLRWRGPSPLLRTGQRRVAFDYEVHDRSPSLSIRLIASDRRGEVRDVSVLRPNGRGRVRVRAGNLYPGTYGARLYVRDDAGNVASTKERPWRVHRAVRARVWNRVTQAGRKVALTFDDCNDAAAWRRILDVLDDHNAFATFFCPGRLVRAHPELAARTLRAGHAVGSHGWDHAVLSGHMPTATTWRLRADRAAWWDTARATSAPLFRPPYGLLDQNVRRAAGRTGHGRIIMWDVDPHDWRRGPPSQIAASVLADVRPGSIVVMHTLPNTAAALPVILAGLDRRGLKAVGLLQMLPR